MSDPPEEPTDTPSEDDPPRRRGGRPSMGPRKSFLLRLSPDVLDELRSWANQDMRSLNGQVEFLLREAVKRRRGKDDDGDG